MKFTDGYWLKRKGWTVLHPRSLQRLEKKDTSLVAYASTSKLSFKGAELDSSMLTVEITPVTDGVIKVRIEHFKGDLEKTPTFTLNDSADNYESKVESNSKSGTVQAGNLRAEITEDTGFAIRFFDKEKELTGSILRSMGLAFSPEGEKYLHEQLLLQPGEYVYGLGERFGPVVKNGQIVDIWNADGGTASEQAYKNIPFYLTNKGYGVFVNHPEKVSFEVGSEVNSRVQFSVPGNHLEYYLIAGPTPKDVLNRYTKLTGRPPQVPAWSYGLWLSTSFTTDYSEETVNSFIDEMERLKLPISVIHFDCYWMRPSHWCDFVWNPDTFPDPEGMIQRYHDRGIKVCVWINPYIAQQSHLFEEGKREGYLLKKPDGSVRQWDHWQSGMGWVDFTNPAAKKWYQNNLKQLLRSGVDSFKTDFGERVPTDVVWYDGSDPHRMHNYYSYLYNEAVYEAIAEERGNSEAIVFARSATAGGQKFPVHWGGDSEPTFVSMAETLRGGLSLGLTGFGFWSHDMGGFEGKPNNDVFIRWFPFGMLSSHSRLHGSSSYRVPWLYGDEAVKTARRFIALKNQLMPYLWETAQETTTNGTPIMRHMILENPTDRGSAHVDTQYYFGPKLIVAPVFSKNGEVEFYLPNDGWTNILDGKRYERAGWYREYHDYDSLPVLAKDGTILPLGNTKTSPEYEWDKNVCLFIYGEITDSTIVSVPQQDGGKRQFTVSVTEGKVSVVADDKNTDWSLCVVDNTATVEVVRGHKLTDAFCETVANGFRIAPTTQENQVEFIFHR